MIFKIIGGVIVAFGLADLVGSFTGVDVWGEYIGVVLPEIIWSYTSYIEIGLGYLMYNFGNKKED